MYQRLLWVNTSHLMFFLKSNKAKLSKYTLKNGIFSCKNYLKVKLKEDLRMSNCKCNTNSVRSYMYIIINA